MSQMMQCTADHDQGEQMKHETLSMNKGKSLYWRALPKLAIRLHGELVLPGDQDFESLRTNWNAAFDGYPAVIVRCADVEDVIAAVTFAREQGLAVSVCSGGYSIAGYGTNYNGMVVDLSPMKAITIDPQQRIARIEPGLTCGEVANALQPYGLALTSSDTASVGIGGLLLGGGIGWMVRKYGLAIDHLRAVDLVTADGEILRASANENADLFWGLRGGGGNFGIATAFEVDLHPAGMILGGVVFYNMAEAERILRAYVPYAEAAPDELTTTVLLMAAPPASFIPLTRQWKPVVAIAVCYTGDLAEGERIVAPLRTLGKPIADMITPIPFPAIFPLTHMCEIYGLHHAVRSLFLQTLNDAEVIHTIVKKATTIMSPGTLIQLRVLGGAMNRVPAETTAFAHRDKQAFVMIDNFGPRAPYDEYRQTRTDYIWKALLPYADGAYTNFIGDEGREQVHEAYPPAMYARLVALKNRYDPTNLFHFN